MILTRENLHPKGYVNQGYSREQVELLGLKYPPKKGWLSKLIGTEIPDERYMLFLKLGELKKRSHRQTLLKSSDSNKKTVEAPQWPRDGNVQSVCRKLEQREKVGFKKYGVTTERPGVDLLGWLRHLQEELMDATVYIEAAIQRQRQRKWQAEEDKAEELLEKIFNPTQSNVSARTSPEDFANQLYETNNKDLE